ncbi:MAG: SAM-dependent methyltransferase [Acidobacteria bacterium]|nr:MAG: SAM-dependent methyltransferase [Acidobacteriota bacterium]
MSDGTRKYFDEVATRWDEMRRQFFGDGVRRAAIAAAGVAPGMVVVDVGIGTGFLAEAALDAGARVIGIDISDAMLAEARAKFAGRSFESRRGDTDHLPLRDGEADAVVANMVLHHAPDPAGAIREMARALKPRGALVVTDADTHTHEWLRTEQHDLWLGFARGDVASWFLEADLEEVTVGDTQETCCPTSNCGTQATITIFLARGRKLIG